MSETERPAPDQERLAELALEVALQQALGAELLDPADPAAGVSFPVRGLAVTPAGTLHAGALNAIVELAAYLAAMPTLAAGEHAVTHASSIQLVAAAREGDTVTVRGALLRRARSMAFCTVTASAGDRTLAHAQVTKSVIHPS